MSSAWNTRAVASSGGGGIGIQTVKFFGAVGDGTTDDTFAVLRSLAATGGAIFPTGVYRIDYSNPVTFDLTGIASCNFAALPGCAVRIITSGLAFYNPAFGGVLSNSGSTGSAPSKFPPLRISGITFDATSDTVGKSNSNLAVVQIDGAVLNSSISDFGVVEDCTFIMGGMITQLNEQASGGLQVLMATPGNRLTIQRCNFQGPGLLNEGGLLGVWLDSSLGALIDSCNFYSLERAISNSSSVAVTTALTISNCNIVGCGTGILLDNAVNCVINNCRVDRCGLPLDINSSNNIVATNSFFGSQPSQYAPVTYPISSSPEGVAAYSLRGFNATGAGTTGYFAWKVTTGCSVTTSLLTLVGSAASAKIGTVVLANDPQFTSALGAILVIQNCSQTGVVGNYKVVSYAQNKTTGDVNLTATPIGFTPTAHSFTSGADWLQGVSVPVGTAVHVHCDAMNGSRTNTSFKLSNCTMLQYPNYSGCATPTVWAVSNIANLSLTNYNSMVTGAEIINCASYAPGAVAPVNPTGLGFTGYTHFVLMCGGGGGVWTYARVATIYASTPAAAQGSNPIVTGSNITGTAVAWLSGLLLYSSTTMALVTSLQVYPDGVYFTPTTAAYAFPSNYSTSTNT